MSDRVTFVHTADLHLDAPFKGIEAGDERVRAALADATYLALERIVEICCSGGVDFLVIAGDAYNSADKSYRAQARFRDAMTRVCAAGVPVFVAQGNHDPASGWSARLPLPEQVAYFPADSVGRFEVRRDGEVVCAVYGRGYRTAAETENLARGFRRRPDDANAVAVLHCNVGGDAEYENYAGCTLTDLAEARMDYWALGHIHKAAVLRDASPCAVYSGSPQGLNPKETGEHGCRVVTLERGRVVESHAVGTAAVVWDHADIDCAALTDIAAVREAAIEACESVRASAARPAVVRIDLTGRSEAHADLARDGVVGQLVRELREAQMDAAPWLWIDRVRDLTRPVIDIDAVRAGATFATDVLRIADAYAADPAAAEALVAEVEGPVAKALGGTLAADPADILERARDLCLDRLLTDGGRG